jgi:two-component system nitrate/nitrite response regulator NarL
VRRAIRVLLVEDNDVYRESLTFLLGRREDVEVVGGIATGSAAAAGCVELAADVAVIDFRLPDIDGAEVANAVRERSPATAVVFLSASAGSEEREAARISGWALVQKDEGVESLVQAIHAGARRDA